ncbi:cell division protein ZapB [Massilia sp. DJPM01]|uniref:cell division protein ZapB n=1 Tax=Massilia sp. DJPM01 TaxID=3024404 RepID=UPI00259D5450|nr:cell division protein ZapB [Massilia sp. DJPM01]MDM5181211.1 cell division protein ZapB [Massilia sp. DJPM01]
MISEFDELSEKIDRLAALTLSLRSENAQLRQANVQLRQSNAALCAENEECVGRMHEVQRRVETLLSQMPDPNAPAVAPEKHDEVAQ